MLHLGVIDEAESEWELPIVFSAKKNDALWFFIDYENLNALTVRHSYTLPCIGECIDALGDATIFSTLDANRSSWQVEIAG